MILQSKNFMRHISRFCRVATGLAMTWVLVACGGGGGGGGGAVGGGEAPCASVGTGTLVLTGTARFESVANNNTNGGLVYGSINTSPMRGLSVQAVCGSTVLATATSSTSGAYSMTVPKNTAVSVKVLAEMVKTTGPANWNVRVRDNTDGNALWAVQNTAVNTGTASSVVRDVTAPLGWTGTSYNAQRASGPFAILDTIYSSMQLVTGAVPATQFPLLNVYWSPNNRPTAGATNLATGELPSSFFTQSGAGAGITRSIYILGQDGVDTDEFDSGVVAHEYGHYLQSAFSQSHSTGGAHALGNKLDMTLAYGEGWGYAFASLARGNPNNPDSSGLRQESGFIIRTGTAPSTNIGWYNEGSVQYVIYSLGTSQGFAPIWAAVTGPMSGVGAAGQKSLNTIFSFAAAVRSAGSAAVTSAMNTLLAGQSIFTGAAADEWGAGETNNGGGVANLPVYGTLTSVLQDLCFTNDASQPDDANNKLGEVRYLRFIASGSGSRTIAVTSNQAFGHDVDLEVFKNGIYQGEATSNSATAENFTLNVATGDVVIARAIDFNVTTASAASCAKISVNN
jgi:hypothetical protein